MNRDIKIAVTGAAGLLGSHLVAELIRDGYSDITLLLRDAGRLPKVGVTVLRETGKGLPPSVKVKEVHLNDPHALDEALRGMDIVFHCAAIVSLGKVSPAEIIENNVEVTAHVVDSCLRTGVGLLVHVSSIAALGGPREGEKYIDERCDIQRLEKTSPYSVSKFFSEN